MRAKTKRRRQAFVLRVGINQSMSPETLLVMWATACGSTDIEVTRKVGMTRDATVPCFGLWVGAHFDRLSAELRMRALLEAKGLHFTLVHLEANPINGI